MKQVKKYKAIIFILKINKNCIFRKMNISFFVGNMEQVYGGTESVLVLFSNINLFIEFLVLFIYNNLMIQAPKQTPGWSSAYIDQQNAPHEFLCPISREIMKNPVITADGYSFERQVIQKWLRQRDKSPITGLKIQKNLIENRALKQAIKFHNERQNKANQNAQKLLQSSNTYLKQILPQLMNDVGLIDINKLITLCIENIELRKNFLSITAAFNKLQRKVISDRANLCQYCQKNTQFRQIVNDVLKGAENIIQAQPIVKELNVQEKIFSYLPLSCNELKKIDFCLLKRQNFKTKIFKSYGIQKSSLQDLIKRIRVVNKIPNTNFVYLWRVAKPIGQFFDEIKKQLSFQKCTYTRKILETGERIKNTKISFDQLALKPEEYLIIQHGVEGQEVFRGEKIRCQYCYDLKPEKVKCTCEAKSYCSERCAQKDKQFHLKQCKAFVR